MDSDCDPIVTVENLGIYTTVGGRKVFNETEAKTTPANPCGLVAKSLFNDTFSLNKDGQEGPIALNEQGIAWESDIKYKFKVL